MVVVFQKAKNKYVLEEVTEWLIVADCKSVG